MPPISVSVKDLQDYRRHPPMTGWFAPVLLAKLLLGVIISKLFGQYADRRLIEAALDNVDAAELHCRADMSRYIAEDSEAAIWIDYVSDLGDGFDATYAIAYLLAQENLRVGELTLPRGSLLIMGGDEVYPTSRRQDYNQRLRTPYEYAFPDKKPDKGGSEHSVPPNPPAFLIPGNHDWYDGLVQFLAMFCRKKATSIGNWRTPQRRSYFALSLRPDWWVWGIDIQLTEDMDQPQADYFVTMTEIMPHDAKVILCSAEPGWYGANEKTSSFRTLSYAAQLAEKADKHFKIVTALSGDTHHYARYASEFETQFVTSGGGGAFLHGTHSLKEEIADVEWLKQPNAKLLLKALYPGRDESRRLLKGNFWFPLLNWEFSILLGVVYWLLAFCLVQRPLLDTYMIVFLILAAGFVAYTGYQENWGRKVITVAVAHGLLHYAALTLLTNFFVLINVRLFGPVFGGWGTFFLLALEMVPVGGLIAGFIFGLHLWLTCRFFDMNHNDAFSAMRLDSHRHFLRLRIKGNYLTTYAIALDRTPKRHEWRDNLQARQGPVGSSFLPPEDVVPKLIEPPFIIDAAKVPPVSAAVETTHLQQTSPSAEKE